MNYSPVQWELIVSQFGDTMALPPEERQRYLDQAGNDPNVRAEVEAMLAAADGAGEFLTRPVSVVAPEPPAPLARGTRLGAWCLVRLVGRGGMGEVYEAERSDGQYEQRAAIKVMKPEAPAHLDRFQVERQILARLDHPGIARLLDGGATPDGRPYAVLEFVEGQPLTEACRARKASLEERLRLFAQVCEAVAHAHHHGIVHRDLKPANILVGTEGRIRLLDFGIAKLLDPTAWPGDRGATTAEHPLTPDYAAPEQVAGRPITVATDVHALGLLLFELLTGRPVWRLSGLPLAGALETVLEAPVPSASSAAAEAGAPVPPERLRGAFDAIVARCLQKEPAKRYPSVDALRTDIERTLRGEPIAPGDGGRVRRLGRSLLRQRRALLAGSTAAVLIALVAGYAAGHRPDARVDPTAIHAYQEGRRELSRLRPETIRHAIQLFQEAIERAPRFAAAHAALANAHRYMVFLAEAPPVEEFPAAKRAAERAIELDPTLPDGYFGRGCVLYWYEWDWSGAERAFRRALELDPKHGEANLILGHLLHVLGRKEEGLGFIRHAAEVAPDSVLVNAIASNFLVGDGQLAEGVAALDRAAKIDPDVWIVHQSRFLTLRAAGDQEGAIAALRRAVDLTEMSFPRALLGQVLNARGDVTGARRLLDELVARSSRQFVQPIPIASLYAALGEREAALEWLEKGVAARDFSLVLLKANGALAPLRDEPRFQAVARTVGVDVVGPVTRGPH